MKSGGLLALILIVVGVILLAWGGYTTFTTRENVAKLGPVEINKETERPVPVGLIVGGLFLVGGIIVFVSGRKA